MLKGNYHCCRNKITHNSTFSSKQTGSPSLNGRDSSLSYSGKMIGLSPNVNKSKENQISEEDYLESKRKVYGQYRPISSNKLRSDYINNAKYQSPRKAALNTNTNTSQNYNSPSRYSKLSNSTNFQDTINANIILETCPYCERNFNKETISRHLKTCESNFKSKSKKFSSTKLKSESFSSDNPYSSQKISNNRLSMSEVKNKTSKNTNWKENSNNFRRAIGVAKDYSENEIPSLVVKYNQCSICMRQFTEAGLKLHFEECNLRKLRIENRQISRQLGPRMYSKSRREEL